MKFSSFLFRALIQNSKIRLYLPFRVYSTVFIYFHRIISLRHDIVINFNVIQCRNRIEARRLLSLFSSDAPEDFSAEGETELWIDGAQ